MRNNIKTEWSFSLFYKNDKDPQIEKDFKNFEKKVSDFEKKYKNSTKYTTNATELLKACKDYEKLIGMPEGEKPSIYFMIRRDVDANNKFINAKVNEISDRLNKVSNKIIFFGLRLGKIEKSYQNKFLKDKSLSRFHYFLKKTFENAKHELSESEEKIINLLNLPAHSMWVNGFSKVLNNQEIQFRGKKISLNEASGMCMNANTKDRRELNDLIYKKMFSVSDFCEAEINAIISGKKISDELRGFVKPYSETIYNYGNEDKTIENLVDVVTKNFKISHRFYKIKAKLIGEKKLFYADKIAKVENLKTRFTYEESIKIVGSAFAKFDQKYADIFKKYVQEGRIDVFPKKGKRGGAYCLATPFVPNLVFLNYTNNFFSVSTLGHEMGHSIHTELSKTQPPLYANYPISIAEVASTFFENFVFNEIYENLSDKEKIIALHNKIDSSVATIFRQIACFNFEKELHETIRKDGYCAKEDMARIMNKHMQSYLGPIFEMKDIDGYNFISWIHIRSFFYVYAYAFGGLISSSLYAEYKKDKNFKDKIEQFLKAGGSKSPEDIFADIGINIRDPKFFENGIKAIEEDIKKLEKLVK